MKFIFKFRETNAKHVQYAVHRFPQEVEIKKHHVPQLIVVCPESRSGCVLECVPSIKLSVQWGIEHSIFHIALQPVTQIKIR